MTPPKSTQAQIDAMREDLQALQDQFHEKSKVSDENHKMLSALHSALMVPQPGQDGKGLLERMADVTVDIESGKRTTDNIIGIARRMAKLGAIVTFLAGIIAALKFGQWPAAK